MNDRFDAVFDALGEPARRRILEALAGGPRAVGEIAAGLPIGRPAVSRHLKVLGDAGLVQHRSVGTRNLYALAPAGLAPAQQWLVRAWDGALAAFAEEIGREADAGGEDQDGRAAAAS